MWAWCKKLFQILVAIVGFVAVIYTAVQLTIFISYFSMSDGSRLKQRTSTSHVNQRSGFNDKYEGDEMIESVYSGIVNILLISLFTLQHSAMANPSFKQSVNQWGFGTVERSLYIIATSASLLVVFYYWHSIPWYLWQFENAWVHYFLVLVHIIIWLLIYGGSMQMDFSEMIGMKQVYYHFKGLSDPMSLKSPDARRLLGHMRHPSFIGFLVLFWLNPYMSLDRLLLAVLLTIYMTCAWNVDAMDYRYHKEQLTMKKRTIMR